MSKNFFGYLFYENKIKRAWIKSLSANQGSKPILSNKLFHAAHAAYAYLFLLW